MPSENTETRKLTAIMFTDMVGYSALAQRNEALALELLEEHRRLLRPIFPRHHGREVETAGDAFLVEYVSALEAVRCAVEIQEQLSERNRITPPERAIRLCIGIHVGDVVHKDGKVMGDAVNIAARIEPLAAAGGICISSAVHEQVRNKLSQPMAALGPAELKNIELPVVVHRVVMPWEAAGPARLPESRRRRNSLAWKIALPVTALALGWWVVIWQPWKKTAAPISSDPPKQTEAQILTQQARALIDDDPLAVRENYRLAEEFGQRAVQLAPTDAEAWATLARASLSLVAERYDDTPARRESARSQAERAIRLTPDSLEAGLAMAGYFWVARQFAEAESRGRELLRRFPDDQRVVELLAESLERLGRPAETRDLLQQHTNSPAGLVSFLDREAYDRFNRNELVDADALLDELFTAKPTANSYLTRLLVLWSGWGDLPAAAEFVKKMPSQLLLEDAFAHHAAYIWMELGQTEKALEVLRRIPRDFLEEKRVVRPKSLLAGRVLQAAGRTAAAEVEWRQALLLVEKRIATEPGRAEWVWLKTLLLAQLGEKAEAQKQLKLWQEMSGIPAGEESFRSVEIQMALGNRDEVIRGFQSVITPRKGRWLMALNTLRHDPFFTPIRSDVRVQEMLAAGENWLKGLREARARETVDVSASPPTPDKTSIAVLAFVNMSADKDNEYFSDGITEEILNALARTPGLRVAARTSAFSFKGKNESVQRIGEALKVGVVLEGSVQRAGNQLRITAQLINVADGFHLWSERFDRKAEDLFAIETEVAQRVQEVLQVKLLAEGSPNATLAGTDNLEAYDLYLRGRHFWNQRTGADLQRAVGLFQHATEKDPKFAAAYAALASGYAILPDYAAVPVREANPKARAAARRALELDGRLAEAHAVLGICSRHDWDLVGAEQEYLEALRLNPNHATSHHWYSILLKDTGKNDEALVEIRKAQALDPLSAVIQVTVGEYLYFDGRYDEALVEFNQALKLSPDFLAGYCDRGLLFLAQKKIPEAIAEFEKIRKQTGDTPFALGYLGHAYARAGRTNEAGQILEKLKRISASGSSAFGEIAFVHQGLGDLDQAWVWYERQVESRDSDPREWKFDPFFADLIKDPRYAALLKKFGLDK